MCLALVMATSPPRYDSIADWYVEFTRRWEERPNALLPDDVVGQRILDQGCGYGSACRHLAGLGASVVGVDLSSEMLAHVNGSKKTGRSALPTSVAMPPAPSGGMVGPLTGCCPTWRSWTSTTSMAQCRSQPLSCVLAAGSASRSSTLAIPADRRARSAAFRVGPSISAIHMRVGELRKELASGDASAPTTACCRHISMPLSGRASALRRPPCWPRRRRSRRIRRIGAGDFGRKGTATAVRRRLPSELGQSRRLAEQADRVGPKPIGYLRGVSVIDGDTDARTERHSN